MSRAPSPLPSDFVDRPFSIEEARVAGVPSHRLRSKTLNAPFHGVRDHRGHLDAAAEVEPSILRRCRAYSLVMDAGHAFSHATAAAVHGIPLPEGRRDLRLHVVALDHGRAPRGRGIAGHTTRLTPVLCDVHGLRVLSAADTWCSLASELSVEGLIAAGERLLGLPEPLASADEILEAVERYGSRTGWRRLRVALPQLRANVYSPRETRTRRTLMRAGLPEGEPNGEVRLRDGRVAHGDLVFRRWRVIAEYDGEQHRTDVDQWTIDVKRLDDLADAGWRVVRLNRRMTDAEIVRRVRRALDSAAAGR